MTAVIKTPGRSPFDMLAHILTFDELKAISHMIDSETPEALAALPFREIVPKVCVAITHRADCWMRVSRLVHEYVRETTSP